jgi:hypothetical protein
MSPTTTSTESEKILRYHKFRDRHVTNGPLRHEDLVKYAQMKGIVNLDPELAGAK